VDKYLIALGKIELNLKRINDSLGWLVVVAIVAIILRVLGFI
jgi:hypothetical protein